MGMEFWFFTDKHLKRIQNKIEACTAWFLKICAVDPAVCVLCIYIVFSEDVFTKCSTPLFVFTTKLHGDGF